MRPAAELARTRARDDTAFTCDARPSQNHVHWHHLVEALGRAAAAMASRGSLAAATGGGVGAQAAPPAAASGYGAAPPERLGGWRIIAVVAVRRPPRHARMVRAAARRVHDGGRRQRAGRGGCELRRHCRHRAGHRGLLGRRRHAPQQRRKSLGHDVRRDTVGAGQGRHVRAGDGQVPRRCTSGVRERRGAAR